jgi:cell division protein FtsQ
MNALRVCGRKVLQAWGHVPRHALSRRRLALAMLLVSALAVSSAWVLLRSGAFAVTAVEVAGTARLSPAAVVAAAKVDFGTPLATLDTDAVATQVRTLPAVRQVEVVRRWPRTVEIAVQERQPAAVRRDGRSYLLVDTSGVAFARVDKRPKGLSLISAAPRVDAAGRSTPPDRSALRACLSVLATLPEPLRRQVVEVRAYGPDDVTLRLTRGRAVIWGTPERGARKATVLAALVTRKARVYDISAPDTPTTRK